MQLMGEPPTNAPLSPDTPVPPSIPDHVLLRPIGRGGYGEVWLAQSITGEWRAVKIVRRANFQDARPFEREFAGIRRAEPISRGHTGLVDILHIGRNDEANYFYYVMELGDDEERGREIIPETYRPKTLRSELRRRTYLPAEECVRLGLSLAEGLAHLHRSGLVHRDIKPANIIFVDGQPKLADIGLVTNSDDAVSFVGTEGYVPPEGPGRPPADIYSLGKVLYEIATGRDRTEFPELPTFAGESGGGPLLELNAVLIRACDPDSRRRYATAEKMLVDLRALAAGRSVKDSPARIWTRRLTTSATVAILLLLANWIYPHLRRPAAFAQPAAAEREWDFDYSYRNVTEPEAEQYVIERINLRKYIEWQTAPKIYWGPLENDVEARLTYRFTFPANTRRIHLQSRAAVWDFRVQAGGRGWGTESLHLSIDGSSWQQLDHITRDGSPYTYDLDLPAEFAGTNQLYVQVRMQVHESPNISYTVAQHSGASTTNREPAFQLRAKYVGRQNSPVEISAKARVETSTATSRHVTLRGSGFNGATAVTFNGVAGAFEVLGDNDLIARIPSHGDTAGPIKIWHGQRPTSAGTHPQRRIGELVVWGANDENQSVLVEGLAKAIGAGTSHNLALRLDGSVVSWGRLKTDPALFPNGRNDVVALAAGINQTLALHADGAVSLVHVGDASFHLPLGLSNVVAIAAGTKHFLALRSDGLVVSWGLGTAGQTDVPPSLSKVVAIAGGHDHSVALRQDGTVTAWGRSDAGQTSIPAGLKEVIAIAAGHHHSLALRRDGTVAAWGLNTYSQCDVPADLRDVIAIAAGARHSVALRADGSILLWGMLEDSNGLPVRIPENTGNIIAVSSGAHHVLGMKSVATKPSFFKSTAKK